MVRSALTVSLFVLLSIALVAQSTFTERVKRATALLYSQSEDGSMTMHCTVTIFEREGVKYRLVSAAHCIGSDDTQKEKVAEFANTPFYITFDESATKVFHRAKVLTVGYQHRGDDFATFEVISEEEWPVVPVGDEREEAEGAPVLNVASPLGLGLQVFHGNISKLELDRPVVQGDINWKGTILLQMPGTDGGSSGSAILSPKQEKIVAFLVGTIGGTTITAIPASRFAAFQKATADGKYRWARTDE
jgi:hypothetical protein